MKSITSKSKDSVKALKPTEDLMALADRAMRRAQKKAIAERVRCGLKPMLASAKCKASH